MEKKTMTVKIDGTRFLIHTSDGFLRNRHLWTVRRHCNADYELHIILSGRSTLEVEDVLYELSANQAILIAPGKYHNPQYTSEDFQRLTLSLTILPGPLEKVFRECAAPCAVLPLTDSFQLFCKECIEEFSNPTAFQDQMLQALYQKLIILLLRQFGISQRSTASKPADWRMDVIDSFFTMPIPEEYTQTKLAQMLHLSIRQLSRILTAAYGMNFRQKMLCSRMDYAGCLLRTTDLKITEICQRAGYNSEAVFYQNFKDYFGMTPMQYRSNRVH